jgi:hypothetical protein
VPPTPRSSASLQQRTASITYNDVKDGLTFRLRVGLVLRLQVKMSPSVL